MSLGGCRFRVFCAVVAFHLTYLSALNARADLVLRNYARPGTVLLNGKQPEESVVTINNSSTFSGQFYGAAVGPVRVSENGNLNFTSNDSQSSSFSPSGFSSGDHVARIAPLWEDYLLYEPSSNAVIDSSVSGQYLAVTWQDVLLYNDSGDLSPLTQTFQAVWFETATTIQGFEFQANDIAFGYQGSPPNSNNFGHLNAVVGITDGAGQYTALPGTFDGFITSPNLLAWQENQFLLFRPLSDPTKGYSASMEVFSSSAVPEPNSLILLGCIAPGYLYYRIRKRRSRLVAADR